MSKSSMKAAERLQLLVERVERLTEEKKGIADDIKDVFGEAKANGFDPAAMKTVIKLRKMRPDDRRGSLAMVEIYMQALGMSEGGLSDEAAAFLADRHGSGDAEPGVDQEVPEFAAPSVPENEGDRGADAPAAKPVTVEDAARMGTEAQAAGRPVTANPFPARDSRRAAWDHAWCAAAGSDGMDIPDHLLSPAAVEKKRKDAERIAAEEAAKAAADEELSARLDGEPLQHARRLVVKHRNGSTAWLQRTMNVSYSEAAILLDKLQRDGVVSSPDLQGRREVLVPEEDDGDGED